MAVEAGNLKSGIYSFQCLKLQNFFFFIPFKIAAWMSYLDRFVCCKNRRDEHANRLQLQLYVSTLTFASAKQSSLIGAYKSIKSLQRQKLSEQKFKIPYILNHTYIFHEDLSQIVDK